MKPRGFYYFSLRLACSHVEIKGVVVHLHEWPSPTSNSPLVDTWNCIRPTSRPSYTTFVVCSIFASPETKVTFPKTFLFLVWCWCDYVFINLWLMGKSWEKKSWENNIVNCGKNEDHQNNYWCIKGVWFVFLCYPYNMRTCIF